MINNSFLLAKSTNWLMDGQAIVATTEDEGLWVSFNFGESWANIDLGQYSFSSPIIPSGQNYISQNVYTNRAAIFILRSDGKVIRYWFDTGEIETYDMGAGLLDMKVARGLVVWIKDSYVLGRRNYDPFPTTDNGQFESWAYHTGYLASKIVRDYAGYGFTNDGYFGVIASRDGSILTGNSYFPQYNGAGYAPGPVAKIALGSKLYAFGNSACYVNSVDLSDSWTTVSLPSLNIDPYSLGLNINGDAAAGGNKVMIGLAGVVYRSTNNAASFSLLHEAVDVRGVSMSQDGNIEAIAIYNQPLKLIRHNVHFDVLPAKKYTDVHVFRFGNKSVIKPKI